MEICTTRLHDTTSVQQTKAINSHSHSPKHLLIDLSKVVWSAVFWFMRSPLHIYPNTISKSENGRNMTTVVVDTFS